MRAINVAVTIALQKNPHQNIFFNGANQHCFFMYQLLKKIPFIKNVWLTGDMAGKDVAPAMLLDAVSQDIRPLNEVIYEVDLLIQMNSTIGQDHAAVIRGREGRIVAYKFGNELILAMESICSNAHEGLILHEDRIAFDETWLNPQHINSCKSFFAHLYRAPVHCLPHLWSPYFIERSIGDDAELRSKWGYKKRGVAKSIGVFEPNISLAKNVLIPMYAINAAWRARPDLINRAHLTNTHALIDHPLFRHLALGCEVCTSHVALINSRFPIVPFVADNIDVAVSHQIENGQNYLYYEMLSGNYPLIHNSRELRDVGYYYDGYDIDAAATQIIRAIETHDDDLEDYKKRSRRYLDSVDPHNASVIAAYEERIRAIFR